MKNCEQWFNQPCLDFSGAHCQYGKSIMRELENDTTGCSSLVIVYAWELLIIEIIHILYNIYVYIHIWHYLYIGREIIYIYRERDYVYTYITYIYREKRGREILYIERDYIYTYIHIQREKSFGRERDYINLFKFIPEDNKLSNFSLNFIFQGLTNDNYINGYPAELL